MLCEKICSLASHTKAEVRNLGVILDSELCFVPHVNRVTRVASYHLRNIVKVWPFLSQSDTEKPVHSFVTSGID